MKKTAYVLTAIAATATILIGLDTMTKPCTPSTIIFILWAVSPYVFLTIIISVATSKVSTIIVFVLCILTCLFGVVLLIDSMYINLDAQGALIYLYAPLWQWAGLLVIAIPVIIVDKVKNVL